MARPNRTETNVTSIRKSADGNNIAINGRTAPIENDSADDPGVGDRACIYSIVNSNVRAQGFAFVQFVNGDVRRLFTETAVPQMRHELFQLVLWVCQQQTSLLLDQCRFRIALCVNRYIFAKRHRDRAGDEPGNTWDCDLTGIGRRSRNSDHDARCEDDAIVCAKDACSLSCVLFMACLQQSATVRVSVHSSAPSGVEAIWRRLTASMHLKRMFTLRQKTVSGKLSRHR